MSADTWEQSITARIGAAVRRLRGKGRSAQWLAEQTSLLGYPIGRATISEIETGRRRTITIAELLILARALNTSPVMLMFPHPRDTLDTVVEVSPGTDVTGFAAAQWFSGHGTAFLPLGGDDLDPGEYGRQVARTRSEYEANTSKIRLAREIEQWRHQLHSVVIPIGGEITQETRDYQEYCESQIALREMQLAVADGDD